MEKSINKIIGVGSCVVMVAVTSKAIKQLKTEPVNKRPYTVASTALWIYCIRSATSVLLSTM